MLLHLLATAAVAALASGARLTVAIPPSPLLPAPANLPPSTHATLLGPAGVHHDALLRRDNTVSFPDLPEASYLLTVHSRDYFFPPLRVDVGRSGDAQTIQAWQTFRGNEWDNKGPSYGAGKDELVIEISPSSQKDFYQPRGGFNILGFLKSPMILMGLVSVAFIFGMPYLMENSEWSTCDTFGMTSVLSEMTVDPETKAEFEEMQKKSPLMGSQGAATQLQNFDMSSWLAGKSTGGGAGDARKR